MKKCSLLMLLFLTSNVFAQAQKTKDFAMQDSITSYQTNVGFNSITDGCPAPPKQPFFTLIASGQQGSPFQYQANIGYTPALTGFFRNTLLGLVLPTLDVGEGVTDFEKSGSASWLQRWNYEHKGSPTISSLISIQVPFDEPGAKTDLVSTLIITKNIRKGVGYFNTYVETTNGFTTDDAEYGTMLGYKIFLPKQKELFVGVMYQTGDILTLETSLEIDFKNGITISPGLNYAISDNSESRGVGGGLVIFYQSPKQLGRKKSIN